MALGPIELYVFGFPGNRFTGGIIPEIERLVDAGTISLVDALMIHKDADGEVTFAELEEADGDDPVARLSRLVKHLDLVGEEDVLEFASALAPNSSAAALVFEHTWAKPLRDQLAASEAIVLSNMRIPGSVVQEVLDAVESLEEE